MFFRVCGLALLMLNPKVSRVGNRTRTRLGRMLQPGAHKVRTRQGKLWHMLQPGLIR